ncbi:MAG: hypothetical protein Q7W13_15495 [Bacteroidia bacterium]|nr:hypothetical protein [Bacteroidia bacterium]
MAKYLEILGTSKSEKHPEKEFIKLKVIQAITNLSNFAILDNTYKGGVLSNLHIHMFILPRIPVKVNDIILISTGKHDNQSEPTADKKNEIHHVFTQTDTPRWNKTGDTVTVILFNVSDSKPLKAVV